MKGKLVRKIAESINSNSVCEFIRKAAAGWDYVVGRKADTTLRYLLRDDEKWCWVIRWVSDKVLSLLNRKKKNNFSAACVIKGGFIYWIAMTVDRIISIQFNFAIKVRFCLHDRRRRDRTKRGAAEEAFFRGMSVDMSNLIH